MERKKTIGIVVVFLSVLLIVPSVFGFGFFNVSNLRLFSSSNSLSGGTTSKANVFVTPRHVSQDYASLPMGSKFTVNVNASSVADLYTWQVNMTWNKAILNASKISAGDFLLRTTSVNKTSSYALGGVVINSTSNAKGWCAMADSILTSVPGITGNGSLVAIQFLVVGYGTTYLNISLTGNLGTSLLNSTGGSIPFTTANGYFDNRIRGDANGDGKVDLYDLATVSAHWYPGPPVGPLGYDIRADMNLDGKVDLYDLALVSANWGRHYP